MVGVTSSAVLAPGPHDEPPEPQRLPGAAGAGAEPPAHDEQRVELDGRALAVVRRWVTDRDVRDADGLVVGDLCDERVEVVALGAEGDDVGPAARWRTWRVSGEAGVVAGFVAAAAEDGVPEPPVGDDPDAARLGRALALAGAADAGAPGDPARGALHSYLAAQVAALLRREVGVRRGEPDAVHQARVACRRLRAALASFRPLLDREVTEPLRDGLQDLARGLGEARDADVARGLVAGLVAGEREAGRDVDATVAPRLEAWAEATGDEVDAHVRAVVAREGHDALLDDLVALVADPPWTARAGERASEVLPRRIRKDWKRVRRLVAAAEEAGRSGDPARREHALHEARKKAKRLRYACEVAEPVLPDARRTRKRAKAVTQVLGELQDTTVTRAHLARLGGEASTPGEAFTWGRLHGLEQARAADRERVFADEAWPALRRRKARAWLG